MTLHTALLQGTQLLERAGITAPRLTAEVLLAHAIGCDRVWLFAHSTDELKELWWIHYGRYLHERLKGKPTQYITGRQEFYGRDFSVTPDVLIPRPETEHLVEAALGLVAEVESPRIVDVGTGSGAIAITLRLERNARVVAADLSLAALRVARASAARLNAAVDFFCGDLVAALGSNRFDLVVSNPPYVPDADKHNLQREVRDFEPELALYGGGDGLAVYRRLIPEAHRILKPGCWLAMEIGFQLAEPIRELLGSWAGVEVRSDLAGLPRVALAQKPQ